MEVQPRLADDCHSRETQRRKNFHGVCLANRIRYIVIPHQNDYRHTGIGQPSYTLGKGALPRGIRLPMFIDIPRENGQMCPMSKRIVNGMMHGAREVEETPIQACGRIQPARNSPYQSAYPPDATAAAPSQVLPSLMQVEQLIIRAGTKPIAPGGLCGWTAAVSNATTPSYGACPPPAGAAIVGVAVVSGTGGL